MSNVEQHAVLVTGATGTLGRKIVDRLVARGVRVRALTRKPARLQGVEVVHGDLSDPESLAPALAGVTAMHPLTLTGDDHVALSTGPEIVALATAAGVRRVTLLGTGEGPVEQAVAASGLEWTVIWPIERRFADWAADHAPAFDPQPARSASTTATARSSNSTGQPQ
ncbi:SDR family oxidoreductase [Actinosynnema sp. CA-248983]